MVIVEKSFPRGGVAPKETKSNESKDNIIFGALQKKFKKTKVTKAKDDLVNLDDDEAKDNIESVSAELLSYDTIQDGMSIMGIVKGIDQLYLSISLPGRMTARVSALEISEAYTKATREFLENSEQLDNFKPLTDIYHIGQIIYGRVQEVKQHEHGRTDINLTLKPAEVHADLSHMNIKKGFIFNGAIEEVQEHGYIIESGIKGMRTFLPVEKSQAGHAVGQLVFLKVEKMTQDKAASTCICKEIKPDNMTIKKQNDPNIDYILPSTIVQFSVTKQLKNGLQGTIMNEAFKAYINEHQLTEPLALPEDFDVKSTLNARILYVMPLTKLIYLTLNLRSSAGVKTELEPDESSTAEPHFKRGDIIEKAKVHRLGTGGVILVLDNKYKGVISYKNIKANYKGNYDQDELLTKYAKKTQHKVRVLDYDPMDSLYICTDLHNIVNEKVFSLDDVQPGEFVTAVVKERDPKVGGYTVQVGKIRGIVEKLFLAPTTKPLEEKSKIRCRVVAVNRERRICYFTNRPEYMSKTCNVLTSLADAKVNALFTGTIVKCHENEYVLVKFFNNLKGVLYKEHLSDLMATEMTNFYVGQTMQFRIVRKNDEQITLGLAEDTFNLGEICPVTVTHTLDSGLEIKVVYDGDNVEDSSEDKVEVKGLIPIRLLSDFGDLLHAKLRLYPVNAETQAVCLVKNIFSLRDVEYFTDNLTLDWGSVKVGDIIKAFVKNVADDVVELMLPIRQYNKLVKLHLNMLVVKAFQNPNLMLSPEQVVYVKVLSKEQITKTITVSARLTDVWNGQLSDTADYLEKYLKEVAGIKKALKKLRNPIAKYSIGDQVTAHFQSVHADTKNWQFQLDKTLVSAVVKASLLRKSKPPKKGDKQECIVLWIDYSSDLVYISNQAADVAHITNGTDLAENFVGKSGINAKILLKQENVFICSLKKGLHPLVCCPTRVHFNDFEYSASSTVKEGDFCKLAFIHDHKPIAVLEDTWKLWHNIQQKRKIQEAEETLKHKKLKLSREAENKEKKKAELGVKKVKEAVEVVVPKLNNKLKRKLEEIQKEAIKNKKKESAKTKKERPVEVLFYEDKTPDKVEAAKLGWPTINTTTKTTVVAKQPNAANLSGISDFWTTDLTQLNQTVNGAESSDEEDNTSTATQSKKKKLTSAEKFKQQCDEEVRIRAIEDKYADPNQLPESVDQFDRLVLSEPNNSKHWINYMVHHLQSTEIDKARAVARRAIKAITFRDCDEQLNIWIALLNLELRYGCKETFDETLKEALIYNDPLKIYLRTVEILGDANKTQELIEMIGVITKKFKAQPEVWKAAALAFFSIGNAERAQQMLHKALACLPEREHVNTIVAFANLNQKHGNHEMAQTLLDQVVTSYPKRVDVWTQYVEMLVKENLIDSARTILDRAILQKIPMKKMRTIFKKYLEFEERFGTEADVEKVKQLATEYVKKNANV